MISKFSKNQQIWRISHQYVCVLLENYREHGFWFTSNKSWDLMKWNACGNVLISLEAIAKFASDLTLQKSSKAIDHGGRRGARCFVAEHVYPTKELQALILKRFEKKNPTKGELLKVFNSYNRICYLWHEEDIKLNTLGLKSSLPTNVDNSNIYSRYKEADISYIETNIKEGRDLFKLLDKLRKEGRNYKEMSRLIVHGDSYE